MRVFWETKEVQEECCRKQQALDALLIQKAIKDKRIAVKTLKSRSVYQKLRTDFSIGAGEAQTLAFALAQKGALVAIDDRREASRRASCSRFHLQPRSTSSSG
jgi:predicted nucleic acid-binding protein